MVPSASACTRRTPASALRRDATGRRCAHHFTVPVGIVRCGDVDVWGGRARAATRRSHSRNHRIRWMCPLQEAHQMKTARREFARRQPCWAPFSFCGTCLGQCRSPGAPRRSATFAAPPMMGHCSKLLSWKIWAWSITKTAMAMQRRTRMRGDAADGPSYAAVQPCDCQAR